METRRTIHRGAAQDREQQLLSGKFISLRWNWIDYSIWFQNCDHFVSFLKIHRKISAHEFERGGLLKPIVNTIDGTPTFLSISSQNEMVSGSGSNPINLSSHPHRPQRLSRHELKHLDEKQLIFELVIYFDWTNWIETSCEFLIFFFFVSVSFAIQGERYLQWAGCKIFVSQNITKCFHIAESWSRLTVFGTR